MNEKLLGANAKGQAQIIALFLVITAAATVTLASQTASDFTAFTGMVAGVNETVPENATVTPDDNLPEAGVTGNETTPVEETGDDVEETDDNETTEDQEPPEVPEENVTIPENATDVPENITEPEENATEVNMTEPSENVTIPENATDVPENITEPEENATEVNVTEPEPEENVTEEIILPSISVHLDTPSKTTRGSIVTLTSVISNTGGSAENVVIEWILPEGFTVKKGSINEEIGELGISSSYTSEITAYVTRDTSRGSDEIIVRVSHG